MTDMRRDYDTKTSKELLGQAQDDRGAVMSGFHHEHDEPEDIDDGTEYHDAEVASNTEKNVDPEKASWTASQPSEEREPAEEHEELSEDETGNEQRDIEKAMPPLSKKQSSKSSKKKDPNIVTWDGPDDPQNPKNWSIRRRWAATLTMSCFTFISPVSSSMVAPSLPVMGQDFNTSNEVVLQLMLSIFVLAYAIGPLFLAPLSEMYGRVPILQLANAFYFVFNLACGFSQTTAQMLVFRFLSGLGGSAPLGIGGGLLGDCWPASERGRAMSVYSLAPLLGPAVGPIAGGFITENTTWRWVFYATCICDFCIQVFGLFFLQETYAPKLLARKTKRLRKETGNMDLRSEYDDTALPLRTRLATALSRPFIMITTQPVSGVLERVSDPPQIIIVLALFIAYLYGLCYIVLSTYPTLWTNTYHESVGIAGLNYISLGIGYFLGAQICAPLNDRIYRRLRKSNNGIGKPEFRIPIMVVSSVLTPIGLFWYGWAAEAHTHWILPNIGQVFLSAGIIVGFQSIQTYIVDAYTRYAASGIAAATVLRSLAGFGFPLFAPAMYNALGFGWGNSVLGFAAVVVGMPAPFLLWRYGERLRSVSKFAAGGTY
ncbi:MAG: hypothetical protein Q9162_006044 [Coniocarpon cinnabarinum]